MPDHEIRIRMVPSLAEIPAADWDACAGQLGKRAKTLSTTPQVAVEDLGQLYADFLRELRRILKPDGKAVLLTDQQEPLEGACRGAGFTCVRVTQFSLHGLHPGVFIIRRAEP